ncbi:hypothetical protein ACQEVF_43575 [Nonomuraea polychroma]|uniref:hypothetical protein n=1 Tax=Nonomuraea polychroma TaxID=46176 RepID=UPI003D9176D8
MSYCLGQGVDRRVRVRCLTRAASAGVGINLVVRDAAADLLTGHLRRARAKGEPVPERATAAVQRRRWAPAVATQALQRMRDGGACHAHRGVPT